MDRVELEFRMDASISRQDCDQLDRYFQHKRWQKQKEKALLRDWNREKQELKDKTVQMIEAQVEEQSQKLKADFEFMKSNRIKSEKHTNLEEQRDDYSRKMEVIDEIKREKELRTQQVNMIKDQKQKKHGTEIRDQAAQFKNVKEGERKR